MLKTEKHDQFQNWNHLPVTHMQENKRINENMLFELWE